MNLYRSCQHQCISCDSRSECYQIEDFRDILVESNAIELLRKELSRKRTQGVIGTGSMNDPYMPLEAELGLTGRALDVIADYQFPAHVLTKSDLVTRDIDRLVEIGRVYAAASFTITTIDDYPACKVEAGAPPTSRRLHAMQALAARGVLTGAVMMPVLRFLEDDEANIVAIAERTKAHGGTYVVAAFGMTLRDRQRAYYYDQLDRSFPGLTRPYQRTFGARYECPATNTPVSYRTSGRHVSGWVSPRACPCTQPRHRRNGPCVEGRPPRTRPGWRETILPRIQRAWLGNDAGCSAMLAGLDPQGT